MAKQSINPAQSRGGYATGTLTPSATGNMAITGVGFTPKMVVFHALSGTGTGGWNACEGRMSTTAQSMMAYGSGQNVNSNTTNCLGWVSAGGTNSALQAAASYVSMDSNGFTINVSTASSAVPFSWEAYA